MDTLEVLTLPCAPLGWVLRAFEDEVRSPDGARIAIDEQGTAVRVQLGSDGRLRVQLADPTEHAVAHAYLTTDPEGSSLDEAVVEPADPSSGQPGSVDVSRAWNDPTHDWHLFLELVATAERSGSSL